MSDGAYCLIVYKNNIFQKQIGFTVSGGKVTHLERLALPTGTYNFYCYNDKVQFDEPQNKFRAEFDNGATALNLDLNASMSNDYTYFVSHTPLNEIVIRFTNGGLLYHKAMNTFAVKKLSQGSAKIDVNKSYTLNVKLVPNFKYVFQDGARGYLRDGGTVCSLLWSSTTTSVSPYKMRTPWAIPMTSVHLRLYLSITHF